MTTITLTDYDIPFNRFDQPLLGVASDAVHLVFFWPATSTGFIDSLDPKSWPEGFKQEMLKKQGGRCTWCTKRLDFNDIHVDHIWPRSKGGRHCVPNLQVLHWWCNLDKAARIGWVLKWDLLELSKLLDGRRQPSITIPPIPIKPIVAVIVTCVAALVVGGYFAMKWLFEDVDGVRRYVHLVRSARESLSHAAGTLSGHLGDTSKQALKVRSSACGFAEKTRGILGQLGRETTHRLITTAGEMPGRFGPAATRIRDASLESLAEPVGLALQSARHAGGSLGDSARTAAGRVKIRAYRAPGLVRGATERVSDMLPTQRRKTQSAFALNT